MSNNTVNVALCYIGYSEDKITAYGFNAIMRTILDEALMIRPDYIEHQVRDPNGRAYNRSAHLTERKIMMQA